MRFIAVWLRIKRVSLRRLVFAALPVLLLLLVSSLIVECLERWGLIQTEVLDDNALYLASPAFRRDRASGLYRTADEFMVQSAFALPKPPDVFRIFVLGGSFALGSPYAVQGAVSESFGGMDDWIELDLHSRFPSRKFEVINAAAGGQNSYRVLCVMKEIVHYAPDLLIVATGNNEGYLPPTRLNQPLHRWALYRLLRKLIAPIPQYRPAYIHESVRVVEVRRHYVENLHGMAELARRHRVSLGLCSMPANLHFCCDQQDQVWPGLYGERCVRWRRDLLHYRLGKAYRERFDCVNGAWFRLRGEWLEQAGQIEAARAALGQSIELKPCGRTRPSFNRAIRRVAAERHLPLFDLENAARRDAPDGIPGYEQFFDNCHMRWRGYASMGREIVDRIAEQELIRGAAGEPRPYPGVKGLLRAAGRSAADLDSIQMVQPPAR